MESAREATADDLASVVGLWKAMMAELSTQRGGRLFTASIARQGPPERSLAADIDDPDRLVVVGTLDDVIVGFEVARVDLVGEDRVGVVESIYVEPDGRGVGVGEAMINLALSWSAAAGCVSADAPALPGNRQAKGFFERHGFTARLLVMNRSLGARPAPHG